MENETFNMHIAAVCRFLSRFVEEISKSASAGVTALSSFDKKRLETMNADLRQYIEFIWNLQSDDNGSALDLVETHPTATVVNLIDPVEIMENNALIDVVEYYKTLYRELMSAQSSRLATGLISHDYERAISILDAIDSYMREFIENVTPRDLPESSPRALMPSVGKTGVRKK